MPSPRCEVTGYACSTSYVRHKCRCDDCRVWQSNYATEQRNRDPLKRSSSVERARRWRRANPERSREIGRNYANRDYRARSRTLLADRRARNAATSSAATRRGRWSEPEVAALIAHPDMPAFELAFMLGRTKFAVDSKRLSLRSK